MIRSLLIANRGEIAVRLARTARPMATSRLFSTPVRRRCGSCCGCFDIFMGRQGRLKQSGKTRADYRACGGRA